MNLVNHKLKKTILISLLAFMVASSLSYSQVKNDSTANIGSGNSKPGLINITDLNVGIGLYKIDVDYSKQKLSLTSICGIGITRNLTGGIGIGLSFYNGGTLFPLFADFRYFTNIGKTRVFVFGDGGILLNSAKKISGTMLFVNPGAGMILPVSDNLSVSLGAGLFTQFRQNYDHDSFVIIKNGIKYVFKNKKN